MSEIDRPVSPSLSRRGLIGGALAAGAAGALVGVPGAGAAVQGSAAGGGAKRGR